VTSPKKYSFTSQTLKFCIAGFFIPGLTAIAIIGLQMGIALSGIECSVTWTLLWILTAIGMVIAPLLFIRRMNGRIAARQTLTTREFTVFNVIQYTLVQATLASFFTSGYTLCYVSDGQNGMEFVLTGWMALPLLIVMSLFLDSLWKRKIRKLNDETRV
jgi:hypothetical protein